MFLSRLVLYCLFPCILRALEGTIADKSSEIEANWAISPPIVQEGQWLKLEGTITFPEDMQWDWAAFLQDLTWSVDPLSPPWYVQEIQLGEPLFPKKGLQQRGFSLQILANGEPPYALFGLQMHFTSADRKISIPVPVVEVPFQEGIPAQMSIEPEPLLPLVPPTFFQLFPQNAIPREREDLQPYLDNRAFPWIEAGCLLLALFCWRMGRSKGKKAWEEWVAYEKKEKELERIQQMFQNIDSPSTTVQEFYMTCKELVRKSSSPALALEKRIDYILFGHKTPSIEERAEDAKQVKALFEEI